MNFRNFTQEYIAKQLEITQAGYSKIERDEVDLTLNKLTQIAKILNVDVADILGFDTNTLCFNTNANDNCVIYQNQSMNEKQYKENIARLEKENERLYSLLEKAISKLNV